MRRYSKWEWFVQAVGFLWGFAFIHLTKYILDNIYPFWSQYSSLSLFAYALIFIAWVSYTLFFHFNPHKNRYIRLVYHIVFFVNALIFLVVILNTGENRYLYFYPFFFSLQLFLYYFLFTSILPSLLFFRIALVLGILTGLVSYPYIATIYIDIFLPAVLYIIPPLWIKYSGITYPKSRQRMLPLRQSIDFLRYLLLGLAMLGTFDRVRDRFYIVIFLLSIGPLLSRLLLWADRKKHHVKYGLFILAFFFILFVPLYGILAINYSAAIGFSFLTIWEGIYFKKTVEGDLRREQILSGIALILAIIYYRISTEWIFILTGIIFVILQSRILVYIAKSYRKTMSAFFAMGLVIWIGAAFFFYSKSFKRNFFVIDKERAIEAPYSLTVFNYFSDPGQYYATNLFPDDVINQYNKKHEKILLTVKSSAPFVLFEIAKLDKKYSNLTYIFSLKNLKPYSTDSGKRYWFDFSSKNDIQNFYMFDENNPGEIQGQRKILDIGDVSKLKFISQIDVYDFALIYSDWYFGKKEYNFALNILKEALTWYDREEILRRIAEIYGILGNTSGQIEYRRKLLDSGLAKTDDKTILMELYFLSGEIDKADEICENLIYADNSNLFTYLEWKYRIIKKKNNPYLLESLYNRILYQISPAQDQINLKENLLQKIRDEIESIPQYEKLFREEKKRQENIIYPD